MKRDLKKMLAVVATSLVALFAVIGASMINTNAKIVNATCEHAGNHYTYNAPTLTESGTKEYWACCKCHEHFLSYTDGSWVENGLGNITDSSDDRFVPAISSDDYKTYLENLGFGSVTIGEDGSVAVGKYSVSKGGTTVIISEGVTKISSRCFTASKMEWIVFPKSLTSISRNSVTSATNCSFYFVGDSGKSKSYFNCKALYNVQGETWDYVKGIPTAK